MEVIMANTNTKVVKVVNIDGIKFPTNKKFNGKKCFAVSTSGNAIFDSERGFLILNEGDELPYLPRGGKKTLQYLIDTDKNFLEVSNYIKPILSEIYITGFGFWKK